MYIRRDSLAQVGLFDTDNFGKGYGEENDFASAPSKRAGATCTWYTPAASALATAKARCSCMETLRRLHPLYERDVMAFVRKTQRVPAPRAGLGYITQTGLPVVLALCCTTGAAVTLRHVQELAQHTWPRTPPY